MAHTNICGKRIIGFPQQFQSVTHWWKEKLRMMESHKVFIPAIVAVNLQPGSIRIQCEWQLCCMNQVPKEAVFKVKDETMSELHNGMPCLWINIRFFRSSTQWNQRFGQDVEPGLGDEVQMLRANVFRNIVCSDFSIQQSRKLFFSQIRL